MKAVKGVNSQWYFNKKHTIPSIFGPVFMTLHKVTDTHILATGGTLKGFFTPIPMGKILQGLNWKVQWGFVFKKTIPFFWFPAHTITFLLPGDARVLFAALLGVVLGIFFPSSPPSPFLLNPFIHRADKVKPR